jgi:hypothetical protein
MLEIMASNTPKELEELGAGDLADRFEGAS